MKITEETPDKIIIESVHGSYDGIIGLLIVVTGILFIIYINFFGLFFGLFFVILGMLVFLSPETTIILDKNSQKVIIIENSSERKETPFSELRNVVIDESDHSFHGPPCPDTWYVRLIINDNRPRHIFQKIGEIIGIDTRPDIFIYEFHDKQ